MLLSMGRSTEAYQRYALESNRSTSNSDTFRSIVRKYPERERAQILRDLIAATPGEEGKWFAAAKQTGELELAANLMNQSPCDPKTLTRAAHDFVNKDPDFALKAGLAALRWLAQGYGFEITGADVWAAYLHTMKAAEQLGRRDEARESIRALIHNKGFLAQVLGRELGLPTP